jgi:hypothetical protein
MDATTEKLNAIREVTEHFLNTGDHKYALASSEISLLINPVDTISMVYKAIAHFKCKNYSESLQCIQMAFQNSDKNTLHELENIMDKFGLSNNIIIHETFLEVDRKVKAKQMVKIMVLLLIAATPLFIYFLKSIS